MTKRLPKPLSRRLSYAAIVAAIAVPAPAVSEPDHAWFPHMADLGETAGVLVVGGAELHPFGFLGVAAAKIGGEWIARRYRDTDPKMCTAIAVGIRSGGWIGVGATTGGLIAGPYGMVAGGILGLAGTFQWTVQSAHETCLGDEPAVTPWRPGPDWFGDY